MRTKRSAASSQRGKRIAGKNAGSTKRGQRIVRKTSEEIREYFASPEGKKEIGRAKANYAKNPYPSAKDMKEIPELDGGRPEDFHRVNDFRPVKRPVTARIDADILTWLKAKGGKYQQHMNAILRRAMETEVRAAR